MGLSLPLPTVPTLHFLLCIPKTCYMYWHVVSQAVVKPYVFMRGLLLVAGDVEQNPGPIQGRQRAGSCQYSWKL